MNTLNSNITIPEDKHVKIACPINLEHHFIVENPPGKYHDKYAHKCLNLATLEEETIYFDNIMTLLSPLKILVDEENFVVEFFEYFSENSEKSENFEKIFSEKNLEKNEKFLLKILISFFASKMIFRGKTENLGPINFALTFSENPENHLKIFEKWAPILSKKIIFDLNNLNNSDFSVKDKISELFLPFSSIFFVDETKIFEGNLNEKGTKNLQLLEKIFEEQKIEISEEFLNYEIFTDFNFLLFLKKEKSLIFSEKKLLKISAEKFKFLENLEISDEKIRKLIFDTKIFAEKITFSEKTREKIVEKFLEIRQKDRNFDKNDLDLILLISRFFAAIEKNEEVSYEIVEEVFNFYLDE